MRNIKIIIEYDGSNYHGWQKQVKESSIQETIELCIEDLTGEDIDLISSGRTDKGVHALGQVANFFTKSKIPDYKFKTCLNNKLPEDIKILESKEVGLDFHSRFSSKMKKYKYIIYNNSQPRPLYRNMSYHVYDEIDIDKFKEASKYFIGEHDFKSFMARKSVVDTTIRKVYDIDIKAYGDFIEVTILGKSFLRHMIRIMIGTLVYVGIGKIELDQVESILEGRDRSLAGKTAPAQGLFLEKVYY